MLRWMLDQTHERPQWGEGKVTEALAAGGHTRFLASLGPVYQLYQWGRRTLGCAVGNGQVETARWIVENPTLHHLNVQKGSQAIYVAAANGHLDMIQYMYSSGMGKFDPTFNGRGISSGVGAAAAAGGHIHVLEWLLSPECVWGDPPSTRHRWVENGWLIGSAAAAIRANNLSMLQWLHDYDGGNFFKFGIYEMWLAAESGSLDIVMWLRSLEPPCEWDHSVADAAAIHGHAHILEYMRETGGGYFGEGTAEQSALSL